MKFLVYLFYFEILLNLVSIGQGLFAPAAFLAQFSAQAAPPLALELARWYAVLLIVVSYLLFRALQVRGAPLKLVLEGLLLGDVVQIGVGIVTANALGSWPVAVTAGIGFSVVLGAVRVVCLMRPQATGIDAPTRA